MSGADEVSCVLCACGCGAPAPLAGVNHARRGWVKGQPLRYVHGHNTRKRLREMYEVDTETGCWNWTGKLASNGYGVVTERGTGRSLVAHRFVFMKSGLDIPSGLQLDHLCRNPRCVNPDHLEPVTRAENVRRGNATKLSPADVHLIRSSSASAKELSEILPVTHRYIRTIRRGEKWK